MFTNPKKISCLMLATFILNACSSTGTSDKRLATENAMDQVVEQQREQNIAAKTVPPEVNKTLLDNQTLASGGLAKTNYERFDVSVRNVAAKDFFLGLVSGTGVNVVVHPDVDGSVTLDLNNVTVDDVLRVTRDIYGYEYKKDRGIYTIYANAMRTEVFQINYLDVQRVGVSDTSVMIGRAQSSGNGGNNSNSNSGGGGNSANENANLLGMIENASQGKESGGGSALTPGSRVQTLNRTDFWSSLEKTVVSIIGGETEDRSVMITPQAGMVVVKAMPHELSAVRDFLERSELSVKRQVILEAKILEVRLSEGFEAGVNWGAISGQISAAKNLRDGFPLNTDGSAPVDEFRAINITRTYIDANGVLQSQTIPSREAIGGTVAGLIQVTDITKLLSLLETQGSVQVLSSPRVSTVNNQKAVIRVGSDEYFVTGISSNQTSNAATTTNTPNIELSSFFSGISLDVTPQISETGEVILHIHPVVSEVTDQQKVFTVGDQEFALPLALRGVRESDSIVKAANGQVIVLGGLMTESSNNVDGKRPLLGDIPGINALFRTKNKSKSKTELVILLRPIVVDDKTWDAQLNEAQSNMQRMGDAYRNQ
ncbi:pilus (MSHA type) biogenesis protein MshL [Cellvibrio fibrivorans]|uniref:MSHA biogenesis protein MshL n=1 Tax=Cellvibrio fibrivorans TaxID=126350 RepID=A0ABU1UY77_9GAMM|nr:pilus (MSHA type) biogenesis protein MshL [Cellvibrio fibrivorans]MDR7090137.1 MSHA biogenesis protein MshL [Cellvibrio fibrivorans]